jgi:hypothetical protein
MSLLSLKHLQDEQAAYDSRMSIAPLINADHQEETL